MHLEITRLEGQRNDLVLRLEAREIDAALLSVANRDRLRALPGIPRHRAATADETHGFAAAKIPIAQHLEALGVIDGMARVRKRAVAISNRNLGANHGHLAWQRSETPRTFRIREDPCDAPAYSCLTAWRDGRLSIEDLLFDLRGDLVLHAADGRDLGAEIEWATSAPRVLRGGQIVGVDEFAHAFYDIRHVLAFDHERTGGEAIRAGIYRGYPQTFRDHVRRAWRDLGVPRARYVHNALGISPNAIVIVQREGTIEEIAAALREAGAVDGLMLDNGGSVACWVWWANQYAGGLISPTVDYRPPGTSAIAFVLKGPLNVELPGGSVSYSVA